MGPGVIRISALPQRRYAQSAQHVGPNRLQGGLEFIKKCLAAELLRPARSGGERQRDIGHLCVDMLIVARIGVGLHPHEYAYWDAGNLEP